MIFLIFKILIWFIGTFFTIKMLQTIFPNWKREYWPIAAMVWAIFLWPAILVGMVVVFIALFLAKIATKLYKEITDPKNNV